MTRASARTAASALTVQIGDTTVGNGAAITVRRGGRGDAQAERDRRAVRAHPSGNDAYRQRHHRLLRRGEEQRHRRPTRRCHTCPTWATRGRRGVTSAPASHRNYDGYDKHRTVIGDEAFIGSDTMLVAPVTIGGGRGRGRGRWCKDVPAGSLAVERTEQRNIPGYREAQDAEHRAQSEGRTQGG